MKPFSLLASALLCSLLLAPSTPLAAQDDAPSPISTGTERPPLMIGPSLGFNRSFHSGGFRTISADETCPVFEGGGGWGFMIGGNAEFALGDNAGLIARLGYESRPATFEADLPASYVLQEGSNEAVPQTLVARSEISYSLVNIDALYRHQIAMLGTSPISIIAGPTVGIVVGGGNRQMHDLILPENARFENPNNYPLERDGRRMIVFDGDIPERSGVRLSLKAGVQTELRIFGNAWTLAPGLYYDFGLSDVSAAENWQVSSLMLGVDFRRAF